MVSGYTLTAFPNAIILQQPQLSKKPSKVHVQMRNKDCTEGECMGLTLLGLQGMCVIVMHTMGECVARPLPTHKRMCG